MPRFRKWLKRLVILGLILVVGLLVGLWALLRTNIPRDLVLREARAMLGVHIDAEALNIAWNGRSTATDVVLTLPLADEPMLTVPELRLRHNSLWRLLTTASFGLDRIVLDEPTVRLVQDDSGQWNLTDLLDRLPTDDQPPEAWGIDWPTFMVNHATLHIDPAARAPIEIQNVRASGVAQENVAYFLELGVGDQLAASGHLKAGPRFEHQAAMHLRPQGDLAQKLLGRDEPLPLNARLSWTGRRTETGVRGRLTLDHLADGRYHLAGSVSVTVDGQQVTLQPESLVARYPAADLELAVEQGAVTLQGQRLELTELDLDVRHPRATHHLTLAGSANLAAITATLDGRWSGTMADQPITHTGEMALNLTRPTSDRVTLEADLTSDGQSPWGRWGLRATTEAEVRDAADFDLRATVANLNWTDQSARTWQLADLTVGAERREEQITLTDLHSPADGDLTGTAAYNLADRIWSVDLRATEWAAGQIGHALTAAVQADGRGDVAEIERLEMNFADVHFLADGDYDPRVEQPLRLRTEIATTVAALMALNGDQTESPDAATDADGAGAAAAAVPADPEVSEQADPTTADAEPRWGGDLRWRGEVTGSVTPLALTARGDWTGENLRLNGRPLNAITWPLTASVNDEQITLTGDTIDLFRGSARFDGRLRRETNRLELDMALASIQLDALARLVSDNLNVAGSSTLNLKLALPLEDIAGMRVRGDFRIEQANIEGLLADQLTGELRTRGAVLRLDPLTMQRTDGRAAGSATLNLRDPRYLRANLELTDWPLAPADAALAFELDGATRLRYDTFEKDLRGRLDATTRIAAFDQPAGELRVAGGFENELLELDRIRGDLFGGTIAGQLRIPLTDWTASRGEVAWNDLDLQRLPEPWNGKQINARGVIASKLAFGPTDEPRAPGPLRIEWSLTGREMLLREMPIQQMRILVYADRDRIVMEEADLMLADGHVDGWASARRRDGRWFSNLQLTLDELDLAEIKRAIDNDAEGDPLVGRVGGKALATGFLGQWPNLVRADLQLTEGDLVGNDIISGIFSMAGVSFGDPAPDGEGEVTLRMEQRALYIERFEYFNRGTDLYGELTIEDVSRGGASRITGFAVAAQRLLKGVPLLSQVDEILAAFQSAAATVSIGGSLDEPAVSSTRLDQISEPLRVLLKQGAGGE